MTLCKHRVSQISRTHIIALDFMVLLRIKSLDCNGFRTFRPKPLGQHKNSLSFEVSPRQDDSEDTLRNSSGPSVQEFWTMIWSIMDHNEHGPNSPPRPLCTLCSCCSASDMKASDHVGLQRDRCQYL